MTLGDPAGLRLPGAGAAGADLQPGNVPLARVENALKLGARRQPKVPVCPSRRRLAASHCRPGPRDQRHGRRRFAAPRAKQSGHAVDYLVKPLCRRAGGVTLSAIGLLTNVAAALQRAPGIGAALAELVIAGGATP